MSVTLGFNLNSLREHMHLVMLICNAQMMPELVLYRFLQKIICLIHSTYHKLILLIINYHITVCENQHKIFVIISRNHSNQWNMQELFKNFLLYFFCLNRSQDLTLSNIWVSNVTHCTLMIITRLYKIVFKTLNCCL